VCYNYPFLSTIKPNQSFWIMKTFLALIHTSFRRQLTYRAANLSGLATNTMFGFFRAAVLIALFKDRTMVNGMSLQAAITYAGFTQALIGYLSFFHWWDLMHSVYDGQIASDLLKPIRLIIYWLGIDIGRALGSLLIRSLPLFIVFGLFYDLILPDSLLEWAAVFCSLGLSLLISFGWRFMVNLAAFWTPNALGIGRFAFGLSWTFSGFFMPLDLFPEWLAAIARWTPFGASVYIPIQIFTGIISGMDLLQGLLIQVLWVVLLWGLDRIILSLGIRKLEIQGG